MKKLFTLIAYFMAILVSSCSEYDDTEIWNKLSDHENRIVKLEELCRQMNTNITALQTIVNALQKNDYITNVAPVREDGKIIGYTITFAYSDTITIYHGEDGVDGEDGADGQNGKDGYTPKIGVMKDSDGVYYWTVDGEWLLDAKGNKIKAQGVDGTDGSNGTNGVDGITPRLKIENDYWYVSYDDGVTWAELGKATGEDGANGSNGEDGDSIFSGVYIEDGFVIFTLNDGEESQIKLPFITDRQLVVTINKAGTLKEYLSLEEQRSVTSIKIYGEFNKEDLLFINTYLHSLEVLDLSDAVYMDGAGTYGLECKINPLGDVAVNRTIRHLSVGGVMKNGEIIGMSINPSYCIALETLILTKNSSKISRYALSDSSSSTDGPKHAGLAGCPNLTKLIIAEGVTKLAISSDKYEAIYCICPIIELSSTIKELDTKMFGLFSKSMVICSATTPPSIYQGDKKVTTFYDGYQQMKDMVLYVPAESVDVYKSTSGWSLFGTIQSIEENKAY